MRSLLARVALIGVLVVAATAMTAQRPPPDQVPSVTGTITIAPVTHGTVQIQYAAHVILVDPARFTPGATLPYPPPGPDGRIALPPGIRPQDHVTVFPVARPQMIRFDGLPAPTLILVTDDHTDHFDANAIDALRTASTVVVGPAITAPGVRGMQVMTNGDRATIAGVALEAVPMYNLRPAPGFTEVFHTKGRGNGYVITLGGRRLYVAGDTACTDEMTRLTNIDVAFLPMNLPATMSPADAAACAVAFKPRIVYPYHYDRADVAAFAKALEGSGIEVRQRDWYVGVPP